MNAISAFFRKHHAVLVADQGPQWAEASDAALCGWAADDCRLWSSPGPVSGLPQLLERMQAVRNELWARLEAVAAEERRAALREAWYSLCELIGFGGGV